MLVDFAVVSIGVMLPAATDEMEDDEVVVPLRRFDPPLEPLEKLADPPLIVLDPPLESVTTVAPSSRVVLSRL